VRFLFIILFPANAYSLQGDTKLFRKKEGSGLHARYIALPPVPWRDTKSSHILGPEFYASRGTQTHLFHQVESFVAQNGKDRVQLGDFVVFCHPTHSDTELIPPVSNIYLGIDSTLTLNQLGIGRVTEVLLKAEENATSHRRSHNSNGLQVTLEVYGFDNERHSVWEVPCIRPSEAEGSVHVAAKVSMERLPSSVH
jgi:hypothetical protein